MRFFIVLFLAAFSLNALAMVNSPTDVPAEREIKKPVQKKPTDKAVPLDSLVCHPQKQHRDPPVDLKIAPPSASFTESGLASKVLKAGRGKEHPSPYGRVIVHYTGWQSSNAKMLHSSCNGPPDNFALSALIPGWTEGLPLMVKGETRRFWIPAHLAFGEKGFAGRPTGQLVFDVELIDIIPEPME